MSEDVAERSVVSSQRQLQTGVGGQVVPAVDVRSIFHHGDPLVVGLRRVSGNVLVHGLNVVKVLTADKARIDWRRSTVKCIYVSVACVRAAEGGFAEKTIVATGIHHVAAAAVNRGLAAGQLSREGRIHGERMMSN